MRFPRIGPFLLLHHFDDIGNIALQHGAKTAEHVAVVPLHLIFVIAIHHGIEDAGALGKFIAADPFFDQKSV